MEKNATYFCFVIPGLTRNPDSNHGVALLDAPRIVVRGRILKSGMTGWNLAFFELRHSLLRGNDEEISRHRTYKSF